MLQSQHVVSTLQAPPTGSLRDEIERRRQANATFSIHELVAVLVPLCTELVQRHARGERFFVNPSAILITPAGQGQLYPEFAAACPASPQDGACLAPEQAQGQPGDARCSVFSVGAIAYEMLTGHPVHAGMPSPSRLVPNLNPAFEILLGKALVTDRAHRPDDLAALAQALHHLAPQASLPPPPADERHLDHGTDFEVDVSLSLLPPPQAAPPASRGGQNGQHGRNGQNGGAVHIAGADPFAMPVVRAAAAPVVLHADDPTNKLAVLKAQLESDPRPRYVVIKDGMDHGPFNAVELLQQLGSHAFVAKQALRDVLSGVEKPILEWEQFAPFAEHAKLNRDIVEEKRAIERVTVAEAKGTRNKMLLGIGLLAILLGGVAGWLVVKRGARSDAIEVAGEDGINVEVSGGLKGEKKKPGSRLGTGPGGIPFLAGGMSCEQARDRYVEEITVGQAQKQADLTANQLGAVLNNGSYLNACGTPNSMHVNVCAAVQNGRAVGVTVRTEPPDARISGCIASHVRRMSFPSNPKLDITTTRF